MLTWSCRCFMNVTTCLTFSCIAQYFVLFIGDKIGSTMKNVNFTKAKENPLNKLILEIFCEKAKIFVLCLISWKIHIYCIQFYHFKRVILIPLFGIWVGQGWGPQRPGLLTPGLYGIYSILHKTLGFELLKHVPGTCTSIRVCSSRRRIYVNCFFCDITKKENSEQLKHIFPQKKKKENLGWGTLLYYVFYIHWRPR